MDTAPQTELRESMSVSPAGHTPGRTPNGTVPPLRRRRQNADPLVRPKDRNKRPPQTSRPPTVAPAAQVNGLAPGKIQSMPHHPARLPTAPPRHPTPDVPAQPEPVSGFSSQPLGPVYDIPLVTTVKALKEGLRHHVARFASKKPVDPTNTEEFTRPVRLHRRDPRIPLPGREDLAGEGPNGAMDEKQLELLKAQKEERKRQQELNMAQIAPSANTSGQRKNHYGKKTQQIYRNDQTDEQRAASRLRYEEAMPWHLEDFDNKSTWVGSYEAALSDTYAVLVLGPDGRFRMTPVEKWYKFTSKQQFKILSVDEAEQAMGKKFTMPKWFMNNEQQQASKARDMEAAEGGKPAKKLYIGKLDKEQDQIVAKMKADPDADDLDFEEDRFADDEENPFHEGPEEDNKEIEAKVKKDQLGANFFDNKDEKQVDAEEEAEKREKALAEAFGKRYKKTLIKREKQHMYNDDDDDSFGDESESDSEAERRRAEEEKKKEEERKADASDRDKASSKGGKASKNPSGSNTPSGRPSKHPEKNTNGLKKSSSSTNLKRPSSANASEASGNESSRSRKKRKQQHLAPSAGTGGTSLKPPSRPMSPDYSPPISSAPSSQRSAQTTAPEQAANPNNKRPRADAGSGSEMSGGEMTDGTKRKKQKLKIRMSRSPEHSPNGSRAVSPDVGAQRRPEEGAKANGAAPKATTATPLDITPDEARALIPPHGITLPELAKCFKGRLVKGNMGPFSNMMKRISHYQADTMSRKRGGGRSVYSVEGLDRGNKAFKILLGGISGVRRPPFSTSPRFASSTSSSIPINRLEMATQPSNVQACADLHNALIQRISGITSGHQRDLVTILQTQHPEIYAEVQGTELVTFLSLIDNPTPGPVNPTPLTPFCEENGGVIYDLATDLATWAFFPPWPAPEDWVPLEYILTQWLDCWERGQFFRDQGTAGVVRLRGWVERDVEEAVEAWDALIHAIVTRLPQPTRDNVDHEEPTEEPYDPILPPSQPEDANFHPFATAFLSRAPLPPKRIKYIAPGSTTFWTPGTFHSLVVSEPLDSRRRQYLSRRRFEQEEIPVPIFPAIRYSAERQGEAVRVPPNPAPPAEAFDQEWGFGKSTFDRLARVYLNPQEEVGSGDTVVVLEGSGRDEWGEVEGRCPWGPSVKGTRLAQMLGMWREYIESGAWGIGNEGVEEEWR
ncbi:MAG: hypothetical protein Q9218_005560 [Villophora microphyllina]